MRFNMNDYIRVRLTDAGRKIHRSNHEALLLMMSPSAAKLLPYTQPKEDDDGWSEWQGWHLMQEFGPWLRLTMDPPFELTVEITEPKKP